MENYKKYDREIVPGIEESLSKIVDKISPNSVVLDIGCSSGMLGRHLVRQKHCVVDGIDLDASALDICHPDYRQVVIADLELDQFESKFVPASYDFVVLADILEHLKQPECLLRQVRHLVKPHGSIIVSVPNITHVASSLELLSGHFQYSSNGLLDSTHVRFYSYDSLVKKLASEGIYVSAVDSVQKPLNEGEFADFHSHLFPQAWLDSLIRQRPDALVYQWVLSARIHPVHEVIDESARTPRDINPVFTARLYWSTAEAAVFNETDKLFGYQKQIAPGEVQIEFKFDQISQVIRKLRIDPVSEQKAVWIKRAYIVNESGFTCWQWTPSRDLDIAGNGRWADLGPDQGLVLLAETSNPQWLPEVPPLILSRLHKGTRFVLVISDNPALVDNCMDADWHSRQALLERLAETNKVYLQRIDVLVDENNQKDKMLEQVQQYIHSLEAGIREYLANIKDYSDALEIQKKANLQTRAECEALIHSYEQRIQQLLNSASWRYTRPLRYVARNIKKTFAQHEVEVRDASPDSELMQSTEAVPDRPLIENDTSAVVEENAPSDSGNHLPVSERSSGQSSQRKYLGDDAPYVPILHMEALSNRPAKLICFYLPQFHAIPENSQWWGEGFTEWTNVRPAQPQFAGHYQPHVPGELGYYDLSSVEVQRRQTELAKLYGIEGFCFYFYWFDGKTLLEQPLLNYLEHSDLDLPFCLCWANENWTRRWDGLDTEILISQKYSEEDDLAFIAHVAKYMRDPRYIRVLGRPLLMVYRPELFPHPKHTANRWRNWCRDNGIGEIYLVCTHSFGTFDPREFDFDAAVEFPPNNSALSDITETVQPQNELFQCKVYDGAVFEERSRAYPPVDYRLFRSVMPSWDNTPRRKHNASVVLHNSPARYQRWLGNAIRQSMQDYGKDERLIFVNAWNEWAEGAHLEPDQKYGYAYLEATRLALLKADISGKEVSIAETQKVLAIVIHAFYEDVLDQILDRLDGIHRLRIKLYVTTTAEKEAEILHRLNARQHEFELMIVENRGRDILPFLKIMPRVMECGHRLFIKIHTKKSLHRADGDMWGVGLFDQLLQDRSILQVMAAFAQDARLGFVGPEGSLVSMNTYFGLNEQHVKVLSQRLGVESETVDSLTFIAGTMFIARTDAVLPLLNLAIDDAHFEPESGQVDATLAHAIERIFSVSAHVLEMKSSCLVKGDDGDYYVSTDS